jgi:hypothetical protein
MSPLPLRALKIDPTCRRVCRPAGPNVAVWTKYPYSGYLSDLLSTPTEH